MPTYMGCIVWGKPGNVRTLIVDDRNPTSIAAWISDILTMEYEKGVMAYFYNEKVIVA